ncbi:MAG: 2-C-methyl-D-erythritol 4-phosphate cytidylyltransferase [Kiritimatiellae bacterium]|nr:2-C-methyl-D-erythritol 4-phosphate cytidylyltransferase [Kiritimatiellia bacterium]
MVSAIIVAAGKGSRMGTASTDKVFLSLGSKPVLAWSLLAFERCTEIDQIVLVVRKEQLVAAKAMAQMFGISKIRKIVAGGAKRQDSVMRGLAETDEDTRYVVIHDGARPCVTSETISDIVKAVKRNPAVVIGRKVVDTIKYVEKGSVITRTEDRSKLWAVQTPQAFTFSLINRAYKKVEADKVEVTDDASAVEHIGESVKILETNAAMLKITTIEDIRLATALVMGK